MKHEPPTKQMGDKTKWTSLFKQNIHFLHFDTEIVGRGGGRGRDCMVVGFTTTNAVSVNHH